MDDVIRDLDRSLSAAAPLDPVAHETSARRQNMSELSRERKRAVKGRALPEGAKTGGFSTERLWLQWSQITAVRLKVE